MNRDRVEKAAAGLLHRLRRQCRAPQRIEIGLGACAAERHVRSEEIWLLERDVDTRGGTGGILNQDLREPEHQTGHEDDPVPPRKWRSTWRSSIADTDSSADAAAGSVSPLTEPCSQS